MASNGGMQPTYGPRTDNRCLTTGGHQQIVNGDEREAIACIYEDTAVRTGVLSFEDDSQVRGIYVEPNFAGS